MRARIIKNPITNCEQCSNVFTANENGLIIKHGEYTANGMKWFCSETCSEQYQENN